MSIEKPDFTAIIKEDIPYTVLPNYVLQNINCPIALAVWCHLISRPVTWEVSRAHLQKHFGLGRQKIDKAIKTLIDMHLLSYHMCRHEDGTVKKVSILVKNGQEYYKKVIEQRILSTTPEIHAVDNPLSGETAAIKERNTTKKRNLEISPSNHSENHDEPVDNSFETFWESYPKKVEKIQARGIWKNISDDTKTIIIKDVNLRKQNDWKNKSKQFIPNPSTYLKNEKWNDEFVKTNEIKSNVQVYGPGHETYDIHHKKKHEH